MVSKREEKNSKTRIRRRTYGPISEGVTDSERGGGKLIKVGVDIFVEKICRLP